MKQRKCGSRWHHRALALLLLGPAAMCWSQPKTPTHAKAATDEQAVTPQLVISFERQSIRENDAVPVRVVITNPSDKKLQDVSLSWTVPASFLIIYPQACGSASPRELQDKYPAAPPPLRWETIASHTDAGSVQTADLCLVSTTANEGDFNLLFELHYAYEADGGMDHSVLTVEKSVKSAFLGSDTLAGIPLSLAGFVVPGLLFWLALDLWKTPWRIQGPGLGDKMIYSVLVSLALIAIASFFPALKERLDITHGLSLGKLEGLAGMGAAVGLLVGLVDNRVRDYRTRRSIHATDSEIELLAKLLRLQGGKPWPKTLVKSKDVEYEGSLSFRTAAETILLGWYGITTGTGKEKLAGELTELINHGDAYNALKKAQKNSLQIAPVDRIHKLVSGIPQPTADSKRIFANADVEGAATVVSKEDNSPPLSMA